MQRTPRGAAMVELAVVLLLLMTILLAAIDFGRFGYAAVTVANAARSGADMCTYTELSYCNPSANPASFPSSIESAVVQEAAILGGAMEVTFIGYPDSDDPYLKVRVKYEFTTFIPWILGISPVIDIEREARMPVGLVAPTS